MLQPEAPRTKPGAAHPRRVRVRLPNGAERIDETDAEGRLVAQHLPDGTVRRYAHDGDGRLQTLDDGRGRLTRFTADAAGLTAALDGPFGLIETTVLRDAEGRPAGLVQRIGALEWRLAIHRDAGGREIGWDYPGAAARLRLHEDGRLAAGARVYLRIRRSPGGTHVRFANGARIEERLADGPGLPRLAGWHLRAGDARVDLAYTHDEAGRIATAGDERHTYDEAGRLTEVAGNGCTSRIVHDRAGRISRIEGTGAARTIRHGKGPMARRVGRRVLSYDALGQRALANGPEGTTRYRHDGLGQLEAAELPDGRTIRYLYDGFGRLVGRVAGEDAEFYLVDPDGRRLATFDGQGRCRHSYIWLGLSCMAAIDGPVGRRLARSFHRAHGGRPVACVDAEGRADIVPPGDPFGADLPVSRHAPGYGGLFGDPETGLLCAGARWLDPQTAQFTTPDSWFGIDPAAAATRRLGHVLRALPGGTGRLLDPATAYDWCGLDPINAVDMNGHNWLGLIFTSISALLWQMQLTSVSLQMEAINVIVEIVLAVVGVVAMIGAHGWLDEGFRDWYWRWSVFNLGAPTASYKLMVPLALWLNGVMKIHGNRAWTLGNVVWYAGSARRELESASARDLVIAPDLSGFLAAQPLAGESEFLVANPQTAATGTAAAGAGAAGLDRINGVTLASGAAATDVYAWADWVRVALSGSDTDTLTEIRTVAAATIDLPTLPQGFDTNAVEISRLDQPWVQIEGGGTTIARPIRFVSGEVLHIGQQLPGTVPAEGLELREFLADARRSAQGGVGFVGAQWIVRAATGSTVDGHTVGDALRIERGEDRFGRRIAGLNAPRDIILDEALPSGSGAALATIRLSATGTTETGQSVETDAAGARIRLSAGRITDLRPGNGVEIAGSGTTSPEVRIVGTVLEAVSVAALPAALLGTAIIADRFLAAGDSPITGTIADGGQAIDTADGAETGVAADQIVRLVQTGGADLAGVVAAVDTAAHRIRLTRTTGLADGTSVTVTGQRLDRTIPAEPAVAPGERLLLRPDRAGRLAAEDILRIRREGEDGGDEVRVVQAAPIVVADLTEPLAGPTGTGLSVQRLVDGDRRLTGASAVATHVRLDFGAPPPFAAGEHLLISDTPPTPPTDDPLESAIAVVGSIDGNAVVLERGLEWPASGTVDVMRVVPTGPSVTGGSLGEGLVLPPAFMDDEPLTRRRALEYHEMRHVFQEALWGPFFISMPIPWLIHLGASFTSHSQAVTGWTRHFSLGGIDSGIAKLWELGHRAANEDQPATTDIDGTLQADRRTVIAAPATTEQELREFAEGHRIEIGQGGTRDFNVVDRLDIASRTITLRFPAQEDHFSVGADLRLSVSLFEQIRKKVQLYFGFNLEQLWADHIPTAWGRALSGFLNRDSWFPGLGLYLLGLMISGGDDRRSPFEQDAAFYSGDLYTSIPLADPHEVFTGQFARIYGFIQARAMTVAVRGNPTRLLTIRLPPGVRVDAVGGGVDAGSGEVRLRESHLLRMHPRVENMVAGLFVASEPGTYELELRGKLRDDVVLAGAMPTAFTERDRVVVAEVRLDPAIPGEVFECEHIAYRIQAGDPSASYALRFPDGPAGVGIIDAMAYTAPAVTATTTQPFELTATYPETHPVFSGPGQEGPARLSAAQRTNVARRFDLTIRPIVVPSVGPVTAGTTADFETPIAPREAEVTSALPAGASRPARVVVRPGRPARLTFAAPDAVDAAVDVTVALRFGRDPTLAPGAPQRDHVLTIRVTPA